MCVNFLRRRRTTGQCLYLSDLLLYFCLFVFVVLLCTLAFITIDLLATCDHRTTLHFSSTGSTAFLFCPHPQATTTLELWKNSRTSPKVPYMIFWLPPWIFLKAAEKNRIQTQRLKRTGLRNRKSNSGQKSSSFAELCCSICVPALRPYWGQQHQNRSIRKKERGTKKVWKCIY